MSRKHLVHFSFGERAWRGQDLLKIKSTIVIAIDIKKKNRVAYDIIDADTLRRYPVRVLEMHVRAMWR
jgi:hypothetical protein